MPSDGESFLPRIQSVFYAGFDDVTGPRILHQVPEGLIAQTLPQPNSAHPSLPPTPSSEAPASPSPNFPPASRNSSSSAVLSPTELRPSSRNLNSPHKRSSSANNILFNFEEVSKYVMPAPALCGRLVICSTRRHRIIGFPSQLRGQKYQRNFFRYNLCFVFEKTADLSCYEPIVRKVSRVLTSCEEESGFLSSPNTSAAMYAILEQLYEDLNSYSETSIPIDQFNSIELKIFPFYPNPPPVKDWMVPVALINLTKRIEDNWDLTMAKICQYIDGVNHVSRIAHLADCDIHLTREAISHLLYYQVIMTIDIFQYSNMYTLCKSIQWLADEAHVKEECGPYSTKPGKPIPDWPRLLHLYSRMKPGLTVLEWMETYNVQQLGIDVRRFASFGVIKGFLRRVHRWPILLQRDSSKVQPQSPLNNSIPSTFAPIRKRIKSFTGIPPNFSDLISPHQSDGNIQTAQHLLRGRTPQIAAAAPSLSSDQATSAPPTPRGVTGAGPGAGRGSSGSSGSFKDLPFPSSGGLAHIRPRRPSAAERILEQLRNRDQNVIRSLHTSPRTSYIQYPVEASSVAGPVPGITTTSSTPQDNSTTPTQTSRLSFSGIESRRHVAPISTNFPPSSPGQGKHTLNPTRPRMSRSPSAPMVRTINGMAAKQDPVTMPLSYPPVLQDLLDGEHHTDELSVRFEAGWPLLEQWLMAIGEGQGDGDFGRVFIIHR